MGETERRKLKEGMNGVERIKEKEIHSLIVPLGFCLRGFRLRLSISFSGYQEI